DAATGAVRWSRWLATGAVIKEGGSQRSVEARGAARPSVPPTVHGGHVCIGTDLGVGALLDAADGRLLWSVRNARRAAESVRREAGLAPVFAKTCGEEGLATGVWLWN